MAGVGGPSRLALHFFLLPLWAPLAQARLETGTVRISAEDAKDPGAPWQYLGKFGYAVGTGTYMLRARLREPSGMLATSLEVFLDEDWPRTAAEPMCSSQTSAMARSRQEVVVGGGWSPWVAGDLMQNVRPHIWYFALSACSSLGQREREFVPRHNESYEVEFELHMQQDDASELSVELRYMPAATLVAVLCLSAFLISFAVRCSRFVRTTGALHPVIKALAVAVALQWVAQVLHLFHLQRYEAAGVGESAPEAYADILFMLSQVCLSSLLLTIARGYTLVGSGDSGALRAMKPIAAIIVVLHVALVGHGKLQGDHSEKHHENEGVVGWALVAVRVLLCSWFVVSLGRLRQRSSGSCKLEGCLRHFQLAGSVYFLSYPVLFVIVQIFAPYLRHPVMHVGSAAVQSVAALWLSDLFLSRGAYYRASSLSSSVLPGASCGFGKERLKAE